MGENADQTETSRSEDHPSQSIDLVVLKERETPRDRWRVVSSVQGKEWRRLKASRSRWGGRSEDGSDESLPWNYQ